MEITQSDHSLLLNILRWQQCLMCPWFIFRDRANLWRREKVIPFMCVCVCYGTWSWNNIKNFLSFRNLCIASNQGECAHLIARCALQCALCHVAIFVDSIIVFTFSSSHIKIKLIKIKCAIRNGERRTTLTHSLTHLRTYTHTHNTHIHTCDFAAIYSYVRRLLIHSISCEAGWFRVRVQHVNVCVYPM